MPFVRSSGAEIYYEVRGTSGPPLVLVRGFASSIRTWNGVDVDLAADHRTIVLDNRGSGRSAAPAGAYRVAQMARDVVAVMSHAGLDDAHVVGTSLGGMIAQELALRYPGRVRSLVLAATAPGSNRGAPITKAGMMPLAAAAVLPGRWRAQLTARVTLSPSSRAKCGMAVQPEKSARSRAGGSVAGLVGQAYAIFLHDAVNRLGRVAAPTLIIHGDSDALIEPQHARYLAELIPNARLESWSGAGHDLATEDPQRLADSVRRHIQSIVLYSPLTIAC